jgi:hypothetical protein
MMCLQFLKMYVGEMKSHARNLELCCQVLRSDFHCNACAGKHFKLSIAHPIGIEQIASLFDGHGWPRTSSSAAKAHIQIWEAHLHRFPCRK